MQTLTLSPELTSILTVEARRTGKSLSTLAEEWLRHQYQTLQRERLAYQTKRFWEHHAALYARHPNQYVAFYNDEVLDHDEDVRQLALRVRTAHGDLPVVIAQVTTEPISGYRIRSPRIQMERP